MHLRLPTLFLATPLLMAAVACAPVDDSSSTASDSAGGSSPSADACTPDSMQTLTPGTLTIGTDSPAYDPWFRNNDPSNGKGFESAVATPLPTSSASPAIR